MLSGRFLMIIPMLAIAGNLAQKKYVPPSLGTLSRSRHPCSRMLLMGVIVIVGALTFFPALSLGPILEHLLMHAGKSVLRKLWSSTQATIAKVTLGSPKIVRRRHPLMLDLSS